MAMGASAEPLFARYTEFIPVSFRCQWSHQPKYLLIQTHHTSMCRNSQAAHCRFLSACRTETTARRLVQKERSVPILQSDDDNVELLGVEHLQQSR